MTAVGLAAVICTGLLASGCATSRQVKEVQQEVRDLERQNQQVLQAVERMEQLVANSEEANNRLRVGVNTSVEQLQDQVDALLQNYNEMIQTLEVIRRQLESRSLSIRSSPGSDPGPPPVTTTDEPTGQTPAEEPRTPSIDCQATYDDAFIKVRRNEYEEAISGFRLYLDECPRHESAENAHYWIGECYYALEQYQKAIDEFNLLLDEYPNSINASRALYKVARSHQELGNTDKASEIYNTIVDEYAGTLEAEQAKDRLKDL